ncbi:MAG: cytochrome b/b6 domain-containing protein [Rubrivivax sp.]|nr:cytochrome b/b6 domain-containing protein [Rubrivivax sp.]
MSGELPERASSARPGEPVWDAFVRLFHWGTVLGVVLNLWVLEEGETAHRYVGYALCAGVLLRVVWGFVGTRHARFASFWPTRQRLSLHWQALKARQPDAHAGHNPLGALAMLMLMALVLLLGLTGWMQGTDAFWGDEWLEELHEGLATALELLALFHALAAVLVGWWQGSNLILPMISGRRRSR